MFDWILRLFGIGRDENLTIVTDMSPEEVAGVLIEAKRQAEAQMEARTEDKIDATPPNDAALRKRRGK